MFYPDKHTPEEFEKAMRALGQKIIKLQNQYMKMNDYYVTTYSEFETGDLVLVLNKDFKKKKLKEVFAFGIVYRAAFPLYGETVHTQDNITLLIKDYTKSRMKFLDVLKLPERGTVDRLTYVKWYSDDHRVVKFYSEEGISIAKRNPEEIPKYKLDRVLSDFNEKGPKRFFGKNKKFVLSELEILDDILLELRDEEALAL
jgi:hypothetical protein